jgi:hypothetical protein
MESLCPFTPRHPLTAQSGGQRTAFLLPFRLSDMANRINELCSAGLALRDLGSVRCSCSGGKTKHTELVVVKLGLFH